MKTPDSTEAQEDKKYRKYLYGWCHIHRCPLDECDCLRDAQDILEEMNRELRYAKSIIKEYQDN